MTDEAASQPSNNQNTIKWVIMAEIWKNNKYFEQTNNRNFGIFDHDFALCHFNMMAAPL